MKRSHGFGWMAGATALTLVVAACSSSSKSTSVPSNSDGTGPTGSTVTLAMANLQDNTAASLPEASAAAQAAVDYINSKGGLLGHKVVLKVCSLRATPESSTACANQFASEKPVAVIGGAVDAPSLIVPTLTKANIPWITSTPADPTELTSPNAFGVNGGPVALMASFEPYLKDKGSKAFSWVSSVAPAATSLAETIGRPILTRDNVAFKLVTHPFTAVDMTPYMTQANQNNPGAIGLNTLVNFCVGGVKAAQQIGISVPILLGYSCETDAFFKGAGSAWTSKDLVTGLFGRKAGDADTEIFKTAMAKFAPSSPANGNAPAGFAAVIDFYNAVTAAKPSEVTAATVMSAMKSAKNVPAFLTLGSTFTCGGTVIPKYPSLCAAEVFYYKVNDGVVTPVAQYDTKSALNG